jgi:glycosyltransferase involved in cell wall biosynthesis
MDKADRKIELCFVITNIYPLFFPENEVARGGKSNTFGGAEVNLYNLALKLSEDPKYKITFLVGDYGQPDVVKFNEIVIKKFKYLDIKRYTNLGYKILRRFYIIKSLTSKKYDIVINSTATEMLGWIAFLAKKIRGAKLVFRLASDVNLDFDYYKRKRKSLYFLYKYGLLNSDLVVSQTDYQRDTLRERYNINIILIKNGFFLKEDVSVQNKQFILWVSRSIDMKRPEIFIEMSKRVPNEKFIIIMPGENSTKEKVREAVKGLPNIELIDFVPFSDIQTYFDKAKLFVNTSDFEGYPNTFIQACLGKTPILSLNVNPDNMIVKYDLGYYCNGDIEKAIECIKQLSDDKIKYYGENAFRYVKEKHNINDSAKSYDEAFLKLLSGR